MAHQTPSYYTWNPSNLYTPSMLPPKTPDLFSTRPVLRDLHMTGTSVQQDNTVNRVLPLLSTRDRPLPALNRLAHIQFLESGLDEKLPDFMVALDASRPWIVYWCLVGLSMLGVDVTRYRERYEPHSSPLPSRANKRRVISTFRPMQNSTGGFGGGHGQLSHLAPSYATVLSLALVGGDALSIVNRVTMLRWLHTLKHPCGHFSVSKDGETDVRGIYCALTLICLLRLPTGNDLLANTSSYLSACQTYEGGFAATRNFNEAHGGYAFCALAALCILHPPQRLPEVINLPALIQWLSARQYAPEGGLSGRTNKLVDGCYSTWVGGCWALVEAAMGSKAPLWNREGLVRYILTCCQSPTGGLRDKPGKESDFYHSAYILCGLSGTQHYYYYEKQEGLVEGGEVLPLLAPFGWKWAKEIPGVEEIVQGWEGWPEARLQDEVEEFGGLKGDRVQVLHPIFNIPYDKAVEAELWADRL
jgi:protein farnesyltransferase subunit beta